MKSFFKYFLLIIVITFAAGFFIQTLSDNGLARRKNTSYNDWRNILDGKINSDVIINGSSRGYVCYNTLNISKNLNLKCFNISFNAGGYSLQQSKFDIYLKKNKKPKLIIQNIDLVHFNENYVLPEEEQFFPFLNNETIFSFVTKYDTKFNYLRYIPLLKYNQNLKLLKDGIKANFSYSVDKNAKTFEGFCPQDRIFKIDYHNLKKEADITDETSKAYIKILNEMVDFYYSKVDKNTKIVFVWAPEYKLRFSSIFEIRKKIIADEMQLIQKRYQNLYFIDMSKDEISNDSKYYYDTFHLNSTGADIFSKKVSMKINNLLK